MLPLWHREVRHCFQPVHFCTDFLAMKDKCAKGGKGFRKNLRMKKQAKKLEAYNWVVSICLKYVSLPCSMVNSLRRGASEPWAWREFYKA